MMSFQKRHTRQFLKLSLNANIISPARTAGIARGAGIHFHDGEELTSVRLRFLASKTSRSALGSTQSPIRGVTTFFPRGWGQGVMLTTRLHLLLKLAMSGSIVLLLLYSSRCGKGPSPLPSPRYFANDGTFISLVSLLLVIKPLIFHS